MSNNNAVNQRKLVPVPANEIKKIAVAFYYWWHNQPGSNTEQVHMCGNSVSPPPMAAIARANSPYTDQQRQVAA